MVGLALFIGLGRCRAAIVVRPVVLHARRALTIRTTAVATVPAVMMARSATWAPATVRPTRTLMAAPAKARS